MGFMRAGRILNVDLSSGKTYCEPTETYSGLFYGGHGINLKILYDRVGPDVSPLDPENLLIFGTGPFTGTSIPGSGRTAVAAKSPQSGLMGRTNFGGYWGPELKYAGYDNLVVTGKADKPVYISINNDKVEIRDASEVWGLDTYQTQTTIKRELDDQDVQIVCIGPAGENLVRYATIISRLGNSGGRTGLGCIMGSKNLKAVVVRGTNGLTIADPVRFLNSCLDTRQKMNDDPFLGNLITRKDRISYFFPGTINNVPGNFKTSIWPEETILEDGLNNLWADYGVKLIGCFNCPVRCMEYYDVPEIGSSVTSCTIYSELGRGIGNTDAMRWYEMSCQAQKYGIDPTSIAGMISWAMELYEKGIINEKDTDGIPMTPGSRDATVNMIEKIVKREGFGDILADNVEDAVSKIGGESEDYMMHVKGIHPLHDNWINKRDMAILLATGNRGDWVQGSWNHLEVDTIIDALPEKEKNWLIALLEKTLSKYRLKRSDMHSEAYEGNGALMAFQRKLVTVTDMLLNCKWHSVHGLSQVMGIENQAGLLSAGEGIEHTPEELFEASERVHVLSRAYNVCAGLSRQKDNLPKRWFEKPLPGHRPDDVLDRKKFELMKDEYYEAMRWDAKSGVPDIRTLEDLKLNDIAEDLINRSKLSKKTSKSAKKGKINVKEGNN